MLVQVAPGNAGTCNPENPIQNKALISRTPPAACTPLDHERLKTTRIGIIGLIDEATLYQYSRAANALAKIFETYIAK